jgi:cysteine desulfuration protein SufE
VDDSRSQGARALMAFWQDTTIEELQENFEFLGDWDQRFTYLLDLGKQLPPLPEQYRADAYKVHGCQAQVWLKESIEPTNPPTVTFVADSDAHLVRGLIAVLMILYAGKTPTQIMGIDANAVFAKLGLDQHLSPTRRNGLEGMVKRIRAIAAQAAAA